MLGGGAGVQRDGGSAFLLGGDPCVEVGEVLIVDADAHLDGDRDVAASALGHDGSDDGAEEVALPRQRGAAALTRYLGDRAAEVEVDVVSAVLLHEDPRGRPSRHRIDAVELHGSTL